jgi:hypothetical protein
LIIVTVADLNTVASDARRALTAVTPGATAVITPLALTVAIAVLALSHVTAGDVLFGPTAVSDPEVPSSIPIEAGLSVSGATSMDPAGPSFSPQPSAKAASIMLAIPVTIRFDMLFDS